VVLAQRIKLQAWHIAFFSLIPIAIGWQPYTVLVTWLLADLIEMAVITKKPSFKERMASFIRRPSFVITMWAIVWGSLILGFQLLNEWRIIGGSFRELPSLYHILWRLGSASAESYSQYQTILRWDNFLADQARRIIRMLVPFGGILDLILARNWLTVALVLGVAIVIAIGALKYVKDKSISYKIPIIFVFSGLLWALLMRDFVAFHDFQAIFYVGFAVAWYMILSSRIHLRALPAIAIVVLVMFVISVNRMNATKGATSQAVNEVTAEFQNIDNQLPSNSKVYVDGDRFKMGVGFYAVDFYLAGSYLTSLAEADYVVSENSHFNGTRLTSNDRVNLFRVIMPGPTSIASEERSR
jgi:hypothetical protein